MRRILVLTALAAFLLLSTTGLTRADGPGYTLDWWTVDGGGAVGAGSPGPYTLSGSIGQPDADVLSDGDYVLAGGFWGGTAPPQYRIYLPLVLRQLEGLVLRSCP